MQLVLTWSWRLLLWLLGPGSRVPEGPTCGSPLSFGVRLPSAQIALKCLVVSSGS